MKKFNKNKVNLYQGDWKNLMAMRSDNYYDLAIVDPEYGLGSDNPSKKRELCKQKNGTSLRVKNTIYKKKKWDKTPVGIDYFDELKRTSKDQIIFGVNYFDYNFRGGRIVWDKLNGMNDQFGCEIAYNSLNNRTDIVHYLWAGMFQGITASMNVNKALIQKGDKKKNEIRIHPTQKPVKLYEWLLHNYAKPDFKILDTHGGSMSSAIAAYNFGCEFDCIELDKDYYNDAVKRFKNQTMQYKFIL